MEPLINIDFDVFESVDIEHFSVAVSIKNTEGTDVVVKTTYDEKRELKTGGKQKICFEMMPRLANGDYYLVIALENRKNVAITYYEYIEGAFFFKMYTDRKIFGIFDVPTKIKY